MQERSHFFGGIELRDVSRVYRAFAPHLRIYWKRFALAYLALFAAMVMNLLKPWPLKIIFDYILLNKTMPHRLELDKLPGRPGQADSISTLMCKYRRDIFSGRFFHLYPQIFPGRCRRKGH